MKGHFVYGILRSYRNHFSSSRTPYIIDRNPTCKELSNNIAAREHPRCGSKQMATYQALAQTQSSWSNGCERTSPRCGRTQMATYQPVAQTQSRCLIAARERPRAGSKQMATYQALVAQTQSSSSSSNLCCSVATQTWSAHVAYSLLHTIHYASSMKFGMLCGAHLLYSLDPKLRCCYCCTYFLAHAAAACLLHFSLSLYFSHLCLFSTKNKLAKLKGLLRVQPNGRRKDEPQRVFFSVRCYEV